MKTMRSSPPLSEFEFGVYKKSCQLCQCPHLFHSYHVCPQQKQHPHSRDCFPLLRLFPTPTTVSHSRNCFPLPQLFPTPTTVSHSHNCVPLPQLFPTPATVSQSKDWTKAATPELNAGTDNETEVIVAKQGERKQHKQVRLAEQERQRREREEAECKVKEEAERQAAEER